MSNGDSTITTGTFELMLEEYAAGSKAGHGQNPYEAAPTVRNPNPTASARRPDLRRLSEWIRTKKHVEKLKDSDEDPLP